MQKDGTTLMWFRRNDGSGKYNRLSVDTKEEAKRILRKKRLNVYKFKSVEFEEGL
jgi:hypothetical protein